MCDHGVPKTAAKAQIPSRPSMVYIGCCFHRAEMIHLRSVKTSKMNSKRIGAMLHDWCERNESPTEMEVRTQRGGRRKRRR
jgi:hypothetical protein